MEFFGKIGNFLRINRLTTAKLKTRKDVIDNREICDEEISPGSKLWVFLLFMSSAVIILKYVGDYAIYIPALVENLLSVNNILSLCYESLSKLFIWTLVSKSQWILLPSFFAAAFVVLSWSVLYKDSDIPGVSPPTPFSPHRYRTHCARSMDFQYALTGMFGFLIFVRLLYQNMRYAD